MALSTPPKSTPPLLLHSQLAYRDKIVCVGGGADEVGGPLCVYDSKGSVCVCEVGFALRVFRGKRQGTFGSVIHEKQTSHRTL